MTGHCKQPGLLGTYAGGKNCLPIYLEQSQPSPKRRVNASRTRDVRCPGAPDSENHEGLPCWALHKAILSFKTLGDIADLLKTSTGTKPNSRERTKRNRDNLANKKFKNILTRLEKRLDEFRGNQQIGGYEE